MIDLRLQDNAEWSVPLLADTPTSVLADAANIRTYAHASIVITPVHFTVGDITTADALSMAMFVGRYMGQSNRGLELEGDGLIGWLGEENDDGDMYAGIDGTSASLTFAQQLDARIFTTFANGLTRGSTNALATARTIKLPGNTTRRQFLDTICALYNSTQFEWRCNNDGSVDFDTKANLYGTTASPTLILTDEGGREGAITGLRAEIDVGSVDVWDYRTDTEVRWSEATPGTNNGVATNTPPAGWVDFAGAAMVRRQVIDSQIKSAFREKPRKSDRYNAGHYAIGAVNATQQATNVATSQANQSASYQIEVQASVDEYNPLYHVQTGDTVYVYDLAQGMVDTSNEVYYRGEVTHPLELRVQAIQTPVLDGYGVYLRYWNGSAFALYDLTPYVEPEEDTTVIDLGTRSRFHRKNARPRRIDRRRIFVRERRNYLLAQYLQKAG